MASKIWWRCLELSSITVVTLYIIAQEQLHNIQLCYTTSSPAQPPHLPPHAPLPRGHGAAAALLCLKSSVSTWLLGFLSWTLVWHFFILLPTWTGLALLESQPVVCKNREMRCDAVRRFQRGLLGNATSHFFRPSLCKHFQLTGSSTTAKSIQPSHPYISKFQGNIHSPVFVSVFMLGNWSIWKPTFKILFLLGLF